MLNDIIPPAPAPYPTAELIAAVADILRYIDKRRATANANAATLTTDEPRAERPPAPKVKKEQKH